MLIELLRLNELSVPEKILYVLILLFALTLSFSVHEFMHAFVADWLGDRTPRNMGRLTLNPIAHMDITGTILLLLAGFGWGKPVMYNPNNLKRFKSHRLMNIMVHLAGVTGNFVLALLSGIIATLIDCIASGMVDPDSKAAIAIATVKAAFLFTESFSLMLLAFNLLPIPPLDGFHVLEELLPYKLKRTEGYRKFEMFAPYGIMVLFVLSFSMKISILNSLITLIQTPFALAIAAICNLIRLPFM